MVLILATELFNGKWSENDIEISGISYDTRLLSEHDLFVCIKGEAHDGHDYAKEAEALGAAVIVSEHKTDVSIPCIIVENSRAALAELSARFYGNPSKRLCLIGVTGTNGKTTVTHLIKSILEADGKRTGLIGTNGCFVGDERVDIPLSTPTTPESLELNRLFAEFIERGAECVVMEVSSHALALERVRGCHFAAGVFTNLTRDHLDFHGSMENYLAAKARLFELSDCAVVNIDDDGGRKIAAALTGRRITVGLNDADIAADNIRLLRDRVRFCFDNTECELAIPGKFSVYNALCAIGACRAVGVSDEVIAQGLKTAHGVKGRVEVLDTDTDYTVIIDYAHSPDGLEKIIHTVRGFAEGRVITLFGCGGDRDKTKRPIMGEIAARLSDFSIITSDNPRTENPDAIISDIVSGAECAHGKFIVIPDRKEAIRRALELAAPGDAVILAGKGQETYQILGTQKRDFDERKIVREILQK